MPDLAAGVLALADDIAPGRRSTTRAIPSAARSVCSCCSTRRTGCCRPTLRAPARSSAGPSDWAARAATVRDIGHGAVVDAASARWFAAGFVDRSPDVAAALLDALRDTDDESYAHTCEALAAFDVTERLAEIRHSDTGDRWRRGRGDAAGKLEAHRIRGQGRPPRGARRASAISPLPRHRTVWPH